MIFYLSLKGILATVLMLHQPCWKRELELKILHSHTNEFIMCPLRKSGTVKLSSKAHEQFIKSVCSMHEPHANLMLSKCEILFSYNTSIFPLHHNSQILMNTKNIEFLPWYKQSYIPLSTWPKCSASKTWLEWISGNC